MTPFTIVVICLSPLYTGNQVHNAFYEVLCRSEMGEDCQSILSSQSFGLLVHMIFVTSDIFSFLSNLLLTSKYVQKYANLQHQTPCCGQISMLIIDTPSRKISYRLLL